MASQCAAGGKPNGGKHSSVPVQPQQQAQRQVLQDITPFTPAATRVSRMVPAMLQCAL